MPSAVISDASCLIILFEIEAIDLLHQTYGEIITTPEVAAEVGLSLPSWITLRQPLQTSRPPNLPVSIDPGEASAIALAIEIGDSILIIDEITARNYAKRLGLQVTGTLGVIAKAKINNVIPSVKPYIEAIRETNFRFSPRVEEEIYRLANEDRG